MLGDSKPVVNRLLDAGCGVGLAFPVLEQYFQPRIVVGVDIDCELVDVAITATRKCKCDVVLEAASITEVDYPDQSFEIIFCHQLLHHMTDQEGALRQFYRLLAPGGVLLIGESCRAFIQSLRVRSLFRHPMDAQRSADEYVELVRASGFGVDEKHVKTATPWWSLWDLGLRERLGVAGMESPEPTEVLIVAKKPIDRSAARLEID